MPVWSKSSGLWEPILKEFKNDEDGKRETVEGKREMKEEKRKIICFLVFSFAFAVYRLPSSVSRLTRYDFR